MDILGSGMIARAFAPYADEFPDTVVFACGVAASTEVNDASRAQEYRTLYEALGRCMWFDQHKRFVYFSSGAVYGQVGVPLRENLATFPTSIYGQHKLLCETIIQNSGVPYLIVRLGNLVGEGQNPAQLVSSLIEQAKTGMLTVQMNAMRDLMDVEDLAHITVDLLRTQTERCETLNVASGQSVPVYNIALKVRLELELDTPLDKIDAGTVQQFDITRLKERLPRTLWFDSGYYRRVLEKYVHAEVGEPS